MSNNLVKKVAFFIFIIVSMIALIMYGADYKLRINDVIKVYVHEQPDLSVTVKVGPDGNISVPIVGVLKAEGRTINEISNDIKRGLEKYLNMPIVSVMVNQYASFPVYVLGEVNSPGVYNMSKEMERIEQVIAQAGNTTSSANLREIIVRRGKKGLEEMAKEIEKIDYEAVLEGKKSIWIYYGDTIYVPKITRGTIKVIGEVARSGEVNWYEGIKLLDVVAKVGGVNEDTADMSNVKLIGLDNKVIEVDLQDIIEHPQKDIKIARGTMILIPKLKRRFVYVSGEVLYPRMVNFMKEEEMTLKNAIAKCGGVLTDNAKEIRLDRTTGESTMISIDNFLSDRESITVEPGDFIYVVPKNRLLPRERMNIMIKTFQ